MSSQLKEKITAAIGAHGLWKGRLATAIQTGKSDCDAVTAARDDACELGKWLHGAIDAALKATPDYAKVKAQHARFHAEAARILRMAAAGKKDDANKALQGDYAKVSAELVHLLKEWKG